jgi:hypothetical protein
MSSSPEPRTAVSFRIKKSLVTKLRSHVRDFSGKPMYLTLAAFIESAIEREIHRTGLIAAGVIPPDGETSDITVTRNLRDNNRLKKPVNSR